jgi:hypothetical protein
MGLLNDCLVELIWVITRSKREQALAGWLNLLLATQKLAALSAAAAATADEIGLSFSAALRIMVITSFNPLVGSFTITCAPAARV